MGNPERWKWHTPLPQDIEERLKSLDPLFEKGDVQLAYLFGSLAAKGGRAARPPGDVDLAVLREVVLSGNCRRRWRKLWAPTGWTWLI